MAISTGKKARRQKPSSVIEPVVGINKPFQEVKPLNTIQQLYLESIRENQITFGVGCAGTGKTYIAAAYAAEQLFYKKVDKVILTRPNVETGRSLGFLPGTLEEKYHPYLEPFEVTLRKYLNHGFYEYCLKTKSIEPKPLGYMRGASYDNAIILVDEAQNITAVEFKMLLTRVGRNTKVIISGDEDQSDIPNSGLVDALNRLEHIRGIGILEFEAADVVRSKLCKEIILAYRR